ncbi:MAG: M28 family peptidase [Clostridia bacterium]|nr:M28 family peptidase [Clostridia bacterium]
MSYYSNIILENYQVRKGKKKKTAFIEFVKGECAKHGYDVNVEKGSFGARNIVVGDPEQAKVVYTAHYDTCAWLPFPNFITPKNIGIYLLYQIFLTLAMIALAFGGAVLADQLFTPLVESWLGTESANVGGAIFFWSFEIIFFVILGLIMAGPANKHTANDNTSGVVTLLELMKSMPTEHKNDAAYIFFDFEESGLIGSSSYASKHKDFKKNGLVINFDCVSDGDTILFVINKKASHLKKELEKAYMPNDMFNVEIAYEKVIYPSDQASFVNGVGVASLKKSKRGILYMDRIHTGKDTIFEEKNIAYLVERSIEFTKLVSEK